MDNTPKELKDRITFLRKQKNLTQAQLAERLGISAQAVSKWESGLSCPDIMMLVPLSDIFEVSTDYLLSGEVKPTEVVSGKLEPAEVKLTRVGDPSEDEGLAKEPCDGTREEEKKCIDEDVWKGEIIEGKQKWEQHDKGKAVYEDIEYIHSLCIDIGIVEAIIKEGDDFLLDTTGYTQGEFTEEVKDGVWTIKDRGFKCLFFGLENIFSNQKVTITVPRAFHFKDVKIKIGAGKLVGRGISTDTSLLDIGAGEIVLSALDSGPSIIKCGMGKVMLEGKLLGKCKFDCGMGEIAASLQLPADYGYKINVGMGEVRLGEEKFGGVGGTYKSNTKSKNFFKIDCGMGAVKVIFG